MAVKNSIQLKYELLYYYIHIGNNYSPLAS